MYSIIRIIPPDQQQLPISCSQSKAGRVKRSDKPTYFRPPDIYVLETSLGAGNTWQVEFAVLFPSVDGQVPQVTAPEEVVQMVDETKVNIEKAVGRTIKKTSVVPEEKVKDKPTNGKTLQFQIFKRCQFMITRILFRQT